MTHADRDLSTSKRYGDAYEPGVGLGVGSIAPSDCGLDGLGMSMGKSDIGLSLSLRKARVGGACFIVNLVHIHNIDTGAQWLCTLRRTSS